MKGAASKKERGSAMVAALAMLGLCTGLALLAFHTATTELQISNYAKDEVAALYLAESGVDQILSWTADPGRSYDPAFFKSLRSEKCLQERDPPDSELPSVVREERLSGPFSELREMGSLLDLRLYRPFHPSGLCTVESKAKAAGGATKRIKVEIQKNPMRAISAGIQGEGETGFEAPTWVHWGKIQYAGNVDLGKNYERIPRKNDFSLPDSSPYRDGGPNEDPLLEIYVQGRIERLRDSENPAIPGHPNLFQGRSVSLDEMDEKETAALKSFAKKYGSYYVVSPDGGLERNGSRLGTFDRLFGLQERDHGLVWIDTLPGYSHPEPLVIEGDRYKGYFYFAGDIRIAGGRPGRRVSAFPHPWEATFPGPISLDGINLDGFFYTFGRADLLDSFSIFGAFYARRGLAGPGAPRLEVWYNKEFASATYRGVPPFVRLAGSWRELFSTSGM